MKNWKTTLFGALAAVATAMSGMFPEYNELLLGFAAVFMALTGLFAKDNAVTGTGL